MKYCWVFTFLQLFTMLQFTLGAWLEKPPSRIVSFTGEDLTLVYGYSTDPSYVSKVRFTIGHYIMVGIYEDLLLEGSLDPVTGHIETKHNYRPSKINVTSYPGGFSITLANLSVPDSGQYLTDFKFSVYDNRHHRVTLTVYNRPHFVKTPRSDDVIVQKDSAFAMQWTLTDVPSQPAIDNLQIKHEVVGVSYTLVHQQSLANGQWGITYPDEQLRFKGRMSYAPGPNLEIINLNLVELKAEDGGLYTIDIAYVRGIANLSNSVRLHVASGFGWISIPRSVTYIIESSPHTLNFTVDFGNSTVTKPTYEFSKLSHEEKRETLASMVVFGNATSHSYHLGWKSDWRLQYNRSTESVLVRVPSVMSGDAGNYTFALKSEIGNIMAYHRFRIVVINESTLIPKIHTRSDGHTISLEIRVDELVLKPYIIVYGNNTDEPHAFARTNTLKTSISRTQEHVVVLVKYDSNGIQLTKRKLVDLSSIANNCSDHVTPSDGLEMTSAARSPTGGSSSDENFHILFGIDGVVIFLLLILVGMRLKKCTKMRDDQPRYSTPPRNAGRFSLTEQEKTSDYSSKDSSPCGGAGDTALNISSNCDNSRQTQEVGMEIESTSFLHSPANYTCPHDRLEDLLMSR